MQKCTVCTYSLIFKHNWDIEYVQTCSNICKYFYFHDCLRYSYQSLNTFLCLSFSCIFFDLICTLLILLKPHIVLPTKLRPQILNSHLGGNFLQFWLGPLTQFERFWHAENITSLFRGTAGAARVPRLGKTANTTARRCCRPLSWKIEVRPRSCRSYRVRRHCYSKLSQWWKNSFL